MKIFYKAISLLGIFLFSSCAAFFNQPVFQEPSRTGEFSKSTKTLLDLPPASQPVEVAVYNFSDQTGQYKAVENGSTFSTAVSQGGTTMLIKALEDSGWFIPIERENLNNLSTERNIIRNTKQEYIKNLNPNEPPLPPLLYAGLILEGGVISYDTNIITGGLGARYFGLGGSSKYRQDRITVYLRAVSTSNGEILKTVYVSKTILSQAIDASFFRFVKFQRLLEAETGITQNEPVQLAMKDAIEKAVHDLIIEGIQKQFWSTQGGKEVNDQLVADYVAEKEKDESTLLFDRLQVSRQAQNALGISVGGNLPDNDYSTQDIGFLGRLEYQRYFGRYFNVGLKASVFRIDNGRQYRNIFASADLNGQFALLPNDKLTPFIYAGSGVIISLLDPFNDFEFKTGEPFFKVQYGVGLEYFISNKVGIKVFGEHNLVFTDKLEKAVQGKRNDFYYNFGVGLNYYFKL
ncbi:CsgG/HfaB family protein [Aequorivita sp. CIP111184]|uniref:CsgG/HfaB family protein n=1 Tax=Aequorivita sp. CIP111184 TaxID=2211356 RepID=UPI000DBBBE20|nr:CsgG/HfaB family protein [Aequorivita sp. CIP111184]SRX54020.1 Curli production assembly/transport component CsgG [Aequorivita sp. CIP111184]